MHAGKYIQYTFEEEHHCVYWYVCVDYPCFRLRMSALMVPPMPSTRQMDLSPLTPWCWMA